MRASFTRALLVYTAIAAAAAINACAASPEDAYDSGYTAPASTTHSTQTPDATSSGDDEAGSQTGDDAGEDAEAGGDDGGSEGGEAGDDSGEAGDDGGDDGGQTASACAVGQTCVNLAPTGWTGYVQLRLAVADAGTGACAAPYATIQQAGVADPTGAPAQCAACTCGAPSSTVTCASGVNSLNLGCSGTDTPNTLTPDTCTNVVLPNGGTAPATLASGSGATCPAHGGGIVGTPDAAVAPPAIVCSLGAGDAGAADAASSEAGAALPPPPTCDPTQACASPIPSQAGPSGVCVFQSGITTCPAGTEFTEQHIVGASIADTRGCACACGEPSCPTDGYIEGFTNNGCTGTAAVVLEAGAPCGSAIKSSTHFKYVQSASAATGACAVTDGGPSGGVSVDNATALTLCCIP